MAKRKKLSVGKILALKPNKLEKMSAKEIRKITTILNSAANKRIKRAAQLGAESEVLRQAMEGGKFTTSRMAKSVTESDAKKTAYAEFIRAREFLQKETSSTRGINKAKRKVIKKFLKKVKKMELIKKDEDLTPWLELPEIRTQQDLNDLIWGAVDKLAESKTITKENRYRVANKAYDIIIRDKRIKRKNTVFKRLEKWADEAYDESVQEFSDVGSDEIAAIFKDFT